jgi:hypothetical protein
MLGNEVGFHYQQGLICMSEELSIAIAAFSLIILLSSLAYPFKIFLSNLDVVDSWVSLQKVGNFTIISTRDIGEMSESTEVVAVLENNSGREITFTKSNVQAFDKEGFVIDEWSGVDFTCVMSRNSKRHIYIRFSTHGRNIDKVRIWDQDIQITPSMFLYHE